MSISHPLKKSLSLATAVPPTELSLHDYLRFVEAHDGSSSSAMRLHRLAAHATTIEKRHTVLTKKESEGVLPFFVGNPGTMERMEAFEVAVPAMALDAARHCLDSVESEGGGLPTHVVTVSCTGFSAPGLDCILIQELGLPATVERINVGFMGCHGAINGLRVAESIVRGHREARVLLVAAESCSLHFQVQDAAAYLPNALFADGAAAMMISGESMRIDTGSQLLSDHREAMTWRITNHGFRMTLERFVPRIIRDNLESALRGFLTNHGLSIKDVKNWAIHPGGPRILDACQQALSLSDEQMEPARKTLRSYGNMSSPTVLFVLEEVLKQNVDGPIVMLAFGPGLTAEFALLNTQTVPA